MIKKSSCRMIFVSTLALSALLLTAACNKKEEQPANTMSQSAAPAPTAAPIDPASAATLNATVKFDGPAPKASKIIMSQDPARNGSNESEAVPVTGRDLATVSVSVTY